MDAYFLSILILLVQYHLINRELMLGTCRMIVFGVYFALKLSLDPVPSLLLPLYTIVASLTSNFTVVELSNIARSVSEAQATNSVFFKIHQFALVPLSKRILNDHLPNRFSLFPFAGNGMPIYKS
jgi:hypothetical protein